MHKKDMYLPVWVCGLGVMFLLICLVCIIMCFSTSPYSVIGYLVGAVICLCISVAAILCWKNQWVEIQNEHEFVYSTMFGRQIKYRFSEITGTKRYKDSMTLLLESGKVHIEYCATVSDRFARRISSQTGVEWPLSARPPSNLLSTKGASHQ